MRSTWRSLDPNGDTSSNGSSQLQPGDRYSVVAYSGRLSGSALTSRPSALVELDRRGQAIGREIGPRPDGERARRIRRRRRDVEAHQLVERRDGVDLLDRPLQPLLQILAQARRLRPERRRDQPLLGFGGMREQRRIHRDRRRQQREEEHREPRRLRDAAHPAVDARQRQRAQPRRSAARSTSGRAASRPGPAGRAPTPAARRRASRRPRSARHDQPRGARSSVAGRRMIAAAPQITAAWSSTSANSTASRPPLTGCSEKCSRSRFVSATTRAAAAARSPTTAAGRQAGEPKGRRQGEARAGWSAPAAGRAAARIAAVRSGRAPATRPPPSPASSGAGRAASVPRSPASGASATNSTRTRRRP